ncbi:MAG: uncharacterized protein QOJ13_2386 [Gaiellales bacterium]|jgi:uncharacterized protein YegP (UPF0339 family)|nr:uncharacterized protein [Gaiellales bacterium]
MYRFLIYRDHAGEWRWTFIAPNNRRMADSGEGYANRSDCEDAIDTLKRQVPTAKVLYQQ